MEARDRIHVTWVESETAGAYSAWVQITQTHTNLATEHIIADPDLGQHAFWYREDPPPF